MMIPFEFPDSWIPRKRMGQAGVNGVTGCTRLNCKTTQVLNVDFLLQETISLHLTCHLLQPTLNCTWYSIRVRFNRTLTL